jgi:hypothetical protein
VRSIYGLAGLAAIAVLGACGLVAGLNDYSKGPSDASVPSDAHVMTGDDAGGAVDGSGSDDGAPPVGDDAGEAGCEAIVDDLLNCGACGRACDISKSVSAACENGACTYSGCQADWLDCDMTPPNADGCESSNTSVTSCGACGNVCDTTQSVGASCVQTDGGAITCEYTGCAPGYADCDTTPPNANGCETSLASIANCGGCGKACDTTNSQGASCDDGKTCSYTGCNAGHADCVNTAPDLDGCEKTVVGATCNVCGSSCDTAHSNGAACDMSDGGATCTYTGCDQFYANCNKTPPDTDGCDTPINTAANCGGCGKACDTSHSSNPQCVSGPACQYGGCAQGYLDCKNANGNFDGCESTSTSTSSCGGCQNVCSTGTGQPSCNGTTCSYSCNSGQVDCNSDNAPDTDGCECATPGCCSGGKCQQTHGNGVGQNFYDCNSTGTHNQTQANEACAAFTGNASACSSSSICCGALCPFLGTTSNSVCGASNGTCHCWQYGGSNPGKVESPSASSCKATCGSGSDPTWN